MDVRERLSGIAERLRLMGVSVRESQLDAADYLIDGAIGIERKTTADFVTTLTGGRLFKQLYALQASVQRALLLIEGDRSCLTRLHPKSLRGALVAVSVKWGIPILWSANTEETATWLHAIMMQRTIKAKTSYTSHSRRKPQNTRTLQRRVLEQVPSIGPHTAEALLDRFGTLQAILNAHAEALRQVDGMGKQRIAALGSLLMGR